MGQAPGPLDQAALPRRARRWSLPRPASGGCLRRSSGRKRLDSTTGVRAVGLEVLNRQGLRTIESPDLGDLELRIDSRSVATWAGEVNLDRQIGAGIVGRGSIDMRAIASLATRIFSGSK